MCSDFGRIFHEKFLWEELKMAFKHYKQIRTQELPSMNIDNVAAFLKDFFIDTFEITSPL